LWKVLENDNCSLNRERIDYARVLISTSSLEVLNLSDQIIVDGVMLDIKIVEELGLNLGDDVCLYEEDNKFECSNPDKADIHDDFEVNNNVDILADHIVNDLADDDVIVSNVNRNEMKHSETSEPVKHLITVTSAGHSTCPTHDIQSAVSISNNRITHAPEGSPTFLGKRNATSASKENASDVTKNGTVVLGINEIQTQALKNDVENGAIRKRRAIPTGSGDDARSLRSGPWGVDWLQNVQHGDIGLISSHKKRLKKVGNDCGVDSGGNSHMARKTKAGACFDI